MSPPDTWSSSSRGSIAALVVAFVLLMTGCGGGSEERAATDIATPADSLAQEVIDAYGGAEAWSSVRFIRFDFAVEQNGRRRELARHLWDRDQDRDRIEWVRGDSNIVAIIDVRSGEGEVYVGGVPADTSSVGELVREAHQRFLNDSFWLLAPLRLMDESVARTYLPDSSDAETEVLRVVLADPQAEVGDTIWVFVNRSSGTLHRWMLALSDDGRLRRSVWDWRDYRDYEAPQGMVRFGTRKEAVDGSQAILTDRIELPASVPDSVFDSAQPVLQ